MAFQALRGRIPIHADHLAVHLLLFLVAFCALRFAMHGTQWESSFVVIEARAVPDCRNVAGQAILLRPSGAAELFTMRVFFVMAAGTPRGSPGKEWCNISAATIRPAGRLVVLSH